VLDASYNYASGMIEPLFWLKGNMQHDCCIAKLISKMQRSIRNGGAALALGIDSRGAPQYLTSSCDSAAAFASVVKGAGFYKMPGGRKLCNKPSHSVKPTLVLCVQIMPHLSSSTSTMSMSFLPLPNLTNTRQCLDLRCTSASH